MRRRSFLAALGTAGAVGTAGCGMVRADRTLSDPAVHVDSPQRKSLRFAEDGEEVGSFGFSGGAGTDVVVIDTQIWHRRGTRVESFSVRVWTPEPDTPADVAVVSPVEGDSSPPPSLTLSYPDREPGTVIEVSDLDDLADETISTFELLARPLTDSFTTLAFDTTIDLGTTDWLDGGYTLRGELELEFPDYGGGA